MRTVRVADYEELAHLSWWEWFLRRIRLVVVVAAAGAVRIDGWMDGWMMVLVWTDLKCGLKGCVGVKDEDLLVNARGWRRSVCVGFFDNGGAE